MPNKVTAVVLGFANNKQSCDQRKLFTRQGETTEPQEELKVSVAGGGVQKGLRRQG